MALQEAVATRSRAGFWQLTQAATTKLKQGQAIAEGTNTEATRLMSFAAGERLRHSASTTS